MKYVGVSHFHADHIGHLAALKNAHAADREGDWDGITSNPPMTGANAKGFAGVDRREAQGRTQFADKDVFGDGSG